VHAAAMEHVAAVLSKNERLILLRFWKTGQANFDEAASWVHQESARPRA